MKAKLLSAKHVLETVSLGFPFCRQVPAGVHITSVQRHVLAFRGVDPAPAAICVGEPALDVDGSKVYQLTAAGVPGCQYLMVMEAALSNGLRLVRAVILPVIEFKAGSGV